MTGLTRRTVLLGLTAAGIAGRGAAETVVREFPGNGRALFTKR